ncbi:MAG: tetratricopeptide repeat protein [Nevskiaceae bacterium]|nr:MAG: tetratricopeptide repeat protein [Nevskiaceae bacterium]TAM27002.1 MAG: tetratricopeptide repeat protein [Nevskiaceae bacterium]
MGVLAPKPANHLLLLLLPALVGLNACTGLRTLDNPIGSGKSEASSSEAALYLDAVRSLMAQGQFYAALAHIQEDRRAHGDSPELRLLEADARRNLGQPREAEALYRGLLNGPQAGAAKHGLGRLYASRDLATAIRYLREASLLRPTDVDVRNDLGYALMQAGRYREAKPELATAAELAPGEAKGRNNLLILLILMRDEAAVRRIADQSGLDATALARLRAQAQSLKQNANSPTTGDRQNTSRTGGAG